MTNPTWQPRIFVGAPTGSLNPQIPSPVYRPSPVAIEIAHGVGIGIDGESLIVSDGASTGTSLSIVGHLDDGTYPQRDFSVHRNGADTRIVGYYERQCYSLHRAGQVLHINGQSANESSVVTESPTRISVDGALPAQRYQIDVAAGGARVQGYSPNESADVAFTADKVVITGHVPERSFEITRTQNGLHVRGKYAFQNFDVTTSADGFTVKGYYPQQKYVVHADPT